MHCECHAGGNTPRTIKKDDLTRCKCTDSEWEWRCFTYLFWCIYGTIRLDVVPLCVSLWRTLLWGFQMKLNIFNCLWFICLTLAGMLKPIVWRRQLVCKLWPENLLGKFENHCWCRPHHDYCHHGPSPPWNMHIGCELDLFLSGLGYGRWLACTKQIKIRHLETPLECSNIIVK